MVKKQGLHNYMKFLLFLSSYIPLFIVLGFLHYTNEVFVIGIAVIIIITLIFLGLLFKLAGRIGSYPSKITEFKDINDMSLEYIITYIFPLLFLNYTDFGVVAGLLIIFLMIAYIYIRSDLIYMNPILNLLGYNIYKGVADERNIIIISKRDTKDIERQKLVRLANKVYLGR